jgi:nucleoside-diphosphate-sugar epimerase
MKHYEILVTGASGFVGLNWVRYCASFPHLVPSPLTRASLTSGDDLAGNFHLKDAVIHFAGKAHDLKNVSDPKEYYDVNFELTKKLYDTFLRSDAQKFIYISSVKAAADTVNGVLDESAEPMPATHYGKSKLLAEQYIESQPLPVGKSFFILRPCMIHGPGNKGNLSLLYKLVRKNIPWLLAGFDNQRSFLSVDNLCFVMKELLENDDIPTGVYHVADDDAISTNRLIYLISSELGNKSRMWKIPVSVIKMVARMGDFLRLPVNSDKLNKLTESYVVSNKKLIKAIVKKLPLATEEGLRLTLRSLKNTE